MKRLGRYGRNRRFAQHLKDTGNRARDGIKKPAVAKD
jgi:hypothetical protein